MRLDAAPLAGCGEERADLSKADHSVKKNLNEKKKSSDPWKKSSVQRRQGGVKPPGCEDGMAMRHSSGPLSTALGEWLWRHPRFCHFYRKPNISSPFRPSFQAVDVDFNLKELHIREDISPHGPEPNLTALCQEYLWWCKIFESLNSLYMIHLLAFVYTSDRSMIIPTPHEMG
jgi:hypothetical protein